MKIKVNGDEMYLGFHHVMFDEPRIEEAAHSKHPVRGFTEAYIGWGEDNSISAIAWCSAEDRFEKAKGRWIALGKLISDLPRKDRKQIGDQYNARGSK